MPTPAAEAASATFVATQARLAERANTLILGAWATTMARDPSDRSLADQWLARAVQAIIQARKLSAQQARGYYALQRRANLPDAPTFRIPSLPELDERALRSSLWFVGPRDYVDGGKPTEDFRSDERLNLIRGSVARHAQAGGRELIDEAIKADPQAVGYYRVEDADPCYFCAMLMSRGVVFKEDSFDRSDVRFFGDGEAKVHDHCNGSVAPSYDADPFPGQTKFWHDTWENGEWGPVPNPKTGEPDVVLGWRQYIEGRVQD